MLPQKGCVIVHVLESLADVSNAIDSSTLSAPSKIKVNGYLNPFGFFLSTKVSDTLIKSKAMVLNSRLLLPKISLG
ncbi:hypothetical protein D3C85_626980 [compost metagenome]